MDVAEELNSMQPVSVVNIAWYVFMHIRGSHCAVCNIKMCTTLEWGTQEIVVVGFERLTQDYRFNKCMKQYSAAAV